MFEINVPGREKYIIKNVVFDYNGTIATNGIINQTVREKINLLSQIADIYILTADTYGSAKKECDELNVILKTFPSENAAPSKEKIVVELGKENTICFGNGFNDIKMFENSILSIAIIGDEGVCTKLLTKSDVAITSIEKGIDLLLNQKSIIATLRG